MRAAIATIFTGLVLAGGPSTAADDSTSWGKSGVAMVDYWSDAAQCTLAGALAKTKIAPGTVNLTATTVNLIDPSTGLPPETETTIIVNDNIMRTRLNILERRRAEDAARQAAVDGCLQARGYRQFKLTDAQQDQLATLPLGSMARRDYLHSLASDPAVLSEQGL